MAITVLYDASVVINSVDLSDHVREVTIDDGVEEKDNTVMSNAAKSVTGGQRAWNIKVVFFQDYASAKVHATIRALVNTTTTIVVKPLSSAAAATNPKWTGTAFVPKYNPIGATVGELQLITVDFKNAGSILTYAEA